MSLIQRVTALAQAVAADIKALYAGKAEKEHTHTVDQVSGLGTAATKNVGNVARQVPEFVSLGKGLGGFGYGRVASSDGRYGDVNDVPKRTGFYLLEDGVPDSTNNKATGVGKYDALLLRMMRHVDGYFTDLYIPYHTGSPGMMIAPYVGDKYGTPRIVSDSLNLRTSIGQSTQYPMTQKAVTDAINARGFADASGILTATSGALSNDMSSYLSSKTYAEMRAKLGVVPVTVVQDTGTSTTAVMSQKAVTEAIAAGGGSSGSVNVVQKDGLSASAVMSQYAVSIALYEMSMLANTGYLYCLEQHAALHALNPATATLPQLITALQSATLLDLEEYLPPPEP